jgi:UDP-3-O-[3-hydroxymyristoyl] glucosamine N-acyltransferase
MEFTVIQIAELIGGTVEGEGDVKISQFRKIQEAGQGDVTFLANLKYEDYLYTSEASAVIVNNDFKGIKDINPTLIRVADPYAAFSVLLDTYQRLTLVPKTGVEEPSYLGQHCTIGDAVFRGAFSYIGSRTTIGNNVQIYPSVFIGENCRIGDNTILYAGAKLYEGTVVGKNCVIHAGAVLGSDGFGFAPQPDGSYKAIPQLGSVTLEDNVSIGANTVVDCATFNTDATLIKEGTKIDNLVQVAHNVVIGKDTVIAAQVGISGSTAVGDSCIIAGQAGLTGHIKISNKTTIAAQSGILKSTKNEGETLFGSPAYDLKGYLSSYAVFKQLPDINRRLRELEKKS